MMKLGKSPEAMHLAYSFVTAFAPTAVSSAYAKPSLQLVQDCLHLGEILQAERRYERRRHAGHDLVIVQQEGVHLVLLTVDNLGVLRAYYCAATAEDTPFLDDLCLMVLDFNRLYRTLSQAFITILATGFLKLEVLFHKSGLCCHITFQEQEVPVWDTPR